MNIDEDLNTLWNLSIQEYQIPELDGDECDNFLSIIWDGDYERVVEELQRNPDLIHAKSLLNDNSLIWASYRGYVNICKYLLEKGIDIEHQGNENSRALGCAAKSGKIEVIDLLLSHGANPYARDKNGWNCLMEACRGGYYELVQKLIRLYPDLINTQDFHNRCTLYIACYWQQEDIAEFLLDMDVKWSILLFKPSLQIHKKIKSIVRDKIIRSRYFSILRRMRETESVSITLPITGELTFLERISIPTEILLLLKMINTSDDIFGNIMEFI